MILNYPDRIIFLVIYALESTAMGRIEERYDCLNELAEDLNLKTKDFKITQPYDLGTKFKLD